MNDANQIAVVVGVKGKGTRTSKGERPGAIVHIVETFVAPLILEMDMVELSELASFGVKAVGLAVTHFGKPKNAAGVTAALTSLETDIVPVVKDVESLISSYTTAVVLEADVDDDSVKTATK